MQATSLGDFIAQSRAARRIRFGDLRRLQRSLSPAALATREDAEALLSLDRSVHKADPEWSAFLIATVRDFVVWGLPPFGSVDGEKAEWLIGALSSGGVTKAARLIASQVVREAAEVDEILIAFAGGSVKNLGSGKSSAVPVTPQLMRERAGCGPRPY